MALLILAIWIIANFPLGLVAGAFFRACCDPQQSPNPADIRDAVARREEAQRVGDPDLKSIHNGGVL